MTDSRNAFSMDMAGKGFLNDELAGYYIHISSCLEIYNTNIG